MQSGNSRRRRRRLSLLLLRGRVPDLKDQTTTSGVSQTPSLLLLLPVSLHAVNVLSGECVALASSSAPVLAAAASNGSSGSHCQQQPSTARLAAAGCFLGGAKGKGNFSPGRG